MAKRKLDLTPEDFGAPKTKGGLREADGYGVQRTHVDRPQRSVRFDPVTTERRRAPKSLLHEKRKSLKCRLKPLLKGDQPPTLYVCEVEEMLDDLFEVLVLMQETKSKPSSKRHHSDTILVFCKTLWVEWRALIYDTPESIAAFDDFAAKGRVAGATFGDYKAHVETLRLRAMVDAICQEIGSQYTPTHSLEPAVIQTATPFVSHLQPHFDIQTTPQTVSADLAAFEHVCATPCAQPPTIGAPYGSFASPVTYPLPPPVETAYSDVSSPVHCASYPQYTQHTANPDEYQGPLYHNAEAVPFAQPASPLSNPELLAYASNVGVLPMTSSIGIKRPRELEVDEGYIQGDWSSELEWRASPKRRRSKLRSDYTSDQLLVCTTQGDTEGALHQPQVVQSLTNKYFPKPQIRIFGASNQAGTSILPEAGNSSWGIQETHVDTWYGEQSLSVESGDAVYTDQQSWYNAQSYDVDAFVNYQAADPTLAWDNQQLLQAAVASQNWSYGEKS